jgi:hypothetical protein
MFIKFFKSFIYYDDLVGVGFSINIRDVSEITKGNMEVI